VGNREKPLKLGIEREAIEHPGSFTEYRNREKPLKLGIESLISKKHQNCLISCETEKNP